MAISEDRQRYIRCLSNDEWVDPSKSEEELDAEEEKWDREREAFVRAHDNPEELHHFVETANWDSHEEDLEQILLNPHCDVVTALYIYWAMQPAYYSGFGAEKDVPDYQRDSARALLALQARILAGEFSRYGVTASHQSFMDELLNFKPHPGHPQSAEEKQAVLDQVYSTRVAMGLDIDKDTLRQQLEEQWRRPVYQPPVPKPDSPFYPSEALLKLSNDVA